MSTISIIIPMYNIEGYIGRCLDSILGQTYTDFEVILVNDGSSDKTKDVCLKYCELDSRIRLIDIKQNLGVSNARNVGMNNAQGSYICFIDGDDEIDTRYLEVLFGLITKHDVSVAAVSYLKIDADTGEILGHRPDALCVSEYNSIEVLNQAANPKYAWVGFPFCKLYRIDALRNIRFDTEIFLCEDYLFNVQVFSSVHKICKSNECLYFYSIRRDSSTFTCSENASKLYTKYIAWKKISALAEKYPGSEFYKTSHREQFVAYISYAKLLAADNGWPVLKSKQFRRELHHLERDVPWQDVPRNTKLKWIMIKVSPRLFNYIFSKKKIS